MTSPCTPGYICTIGSSRLLRAPYAVRRSDSPAALWRSWILFAPASSLPSPLSRLPAEMQRPASRQSSTRAQGIQVDASKKHASSARHPAKFMYDGEGVCLDGWAHTYGRVSAYLPA